MLFRCIDRNSVCLLPVVVEVPLVIEPACHTAFPLVECMSLWPLVAVVQVAVMCMLKYAPLNREEKTYK
jgi:hypothetical protein